MRAETPMRHARQSGFSLIEILVVITIIGLLMTIGFGPVQNALESGRVTKCRKQLADIGQAMLLYKDQRNKGRWPKDSGIRFLLRLHKAGEISGNNSETFICPGTTSDVRNDLGVSGEPGSSYEDWDDIDPASISYAGRDQEAYPLRGQDDSEMVIGADDNEFGRNHKYITNYVMADGSTHFFDIKSEDGDQVLDEYPEFEKQGLPIGPDCPLELFQVLRID
jgi:prepilin-type N-terminal cleavage/methylation domain-containing protein